MNPGETGLSIEALGDRLAILNLLGAYAHFASVGDLAGWRDTFTDDATYQVAAPGLPGIPLPMDRVVEAERASFARKAAVEHDPTLGERVIFRIANPFIVSQTMDSAEIIAQLSICRTGIDGPPPRIWLTGRFSGTLHKRDSCWRIYRWRIDTTRSPDKSWALNPETDPD